MNSLALICSRDSARCRTPELFGSQRPVPFLRLRRRRFIIPSGKPQLTHDSVECRSDTLGTSNLVFLTRRIPVQFKRPPLAAMGEQTAKREADLDSIDPRFTAAGYAAAQDMHGKRNDYALMFRQACIHLNENHAT
ncbi:hypothetical protein [Novosphingobium guangzhouense]|uniref:hypothetical protein n=1 Tax=Novosphingobium guangzhouense TaxID=1850347 RepID=UPI0014736640|nr:hypothetical protein [Novosphingobium guangzhouense]